MDEAFERELDWMMKRKRYSYDETSKQLGYNDLECVRCEVAYLEFMLHELSKVSEDLKMTVSGIMNERTKNESD